MLRLDLQRAHLRSVLPYNRVVALRGDKQRGGPHKNINTIRLVCMLPLAQKKIKSFTSSKSRQARTHNPHALHVHALPKPQRVYLQVVVLRLHIRQIDKLRLRYSLVCLSEHTLLEQQLAWEALLRNQDACRVSATATAALNNMAWLVM